MTQSFTPASGNADAGERVDAAGESSARSRILRLFSRVTLSGAFIPEIDGLRFIAIGSVLLFHLMEALRIKAPQVYVPASGDGLFATVVMKGYHGVELFFVISGFILALPFASHHLKAAKAVSLRAYFLRRLTRLEPPYVLSLLLMAALLIVAKGEGVGSTLTSLAASTFYLHNLAFGAPSAINNVAWSLEVEIQFYVLVPLLALVFAIRSKLLRRTVLIATICVWTFCAWRFLSPEHPRSYLSILRFLPFFLTGFLLADIYLSDWKGRVSRNFVWDVAWALGWCTLVFIWLSGAQYVGENSLLAALLFPSLTLLVYVATFRGRISNWIMTNPVITVIGGMCYTIYLLHNVLISAVLRVTSNFGSVGSLEADFFVQCLVVLPIVLAVCSIYFLLIEKPCMQRDWPQRLHAWITTTFSRNR